MQLVNDTIKISHVLTDAEKQLRAEILSYKPGDTKPVEGSLKQPVQPARLDWTSFKGSFEPTREAAITQKRDTEDRPKEPPTAGHLEILNKQTEIMQQNQAILLQLAEKTSKTKSSREDRDVGRSAAQAEKHVALQFMKQVEPLMAEMKALRAEFEGLKRREAYPGGKTSIKGSELAYLDAEKGRLLSKAREIGRKARQMKTDGVTEKLASEKRDADEFLGKIESKMSRMEEKLRVEKESIAAAVERERDTAEARKEVIRATQKVDFLSSKKAQQERLGSDFDYQQFLLEVDGLALEVSKAKAEFAAERREFEVPVVEVRVSAREAAQIAARAKPEIEVLELKKRQFGEKYAKFVASAKNVGKNNIAFQKLPDSALAVFERGDRFWTLKPDYLKSLRTTPLEAPRPIEFRRLREAKHTILVDHDLEIERLRRQMASLDSPMERDGSGVAGVVNVNSRFFGMVTTSANLPSQKKAPIFFDVEDSVPCQADPPACNTKTAPNRSFRFPEASFGQDPTEFRVFKSQDSPKSADLANQSRLGPTQKVRETDYVNILNFGKKTAPQRSSPSPSPARRSGPSPAVPSPLHRILGESQNQISVRKASPSPSKAASPSGLTLNGFLRSTFSPERRQKTDISPKNQRPQLPEPDAVGGADLFQALHEIRSLGKAPQTPAKLTDFRSVFGLTDESSGNESGLADYLEIYREELTSRDSLEVSDFSVQQNYSQVLVSPQEILEVVSKTKLWKNKPQLFGK